LFWREEFCRECSQKGQKEHSVQEIMLVHRQLYSKEEQEVYQIFLTHQFRSKRLTNNYNYVRVFVRLTIIMTSLIYFASTDFIKLARENVSSIKEEK
jgi:hypothetical protein